MAQVLIVDDSSTVRDEVAGALTKHGFFVTTASDGKEALDILRADANIKLVVSDVNMPIMDGLTMVEKIRSELKNSKVNVVMLTTESGVNMKERGRAAGVRAWIVKPFKVDAVIPGFRKLVA